MPGSNPIATYTTPIHGLEHTSYCDLWDGVTNVEGGGLDLKGQEKTCIVTFATADT